MDLSQSLLKFLLVYHYNQALEWTEFAGYIYIYIAIYTLIQCKWKTKMKKKKKKLNCGRTNFCFCLLLIHKSNENLAEMIWKIPLLTYLNSMNRFLISIQTHFRLLSAHIHFLWIPTLYTCIYKIIIRRTSEKGFTNK